MQVCSYAGVVLMGVLGVITVAGGCASSSPPPPSSAEPTSADETMAETDMAGGEEAAADPSSDTGSEATSEAAGADPSANAEATADEGGASSSGSERNLTAVQKLVSDNRKPVRECYEKARKELPDLKGTLTIKFVIDPEGNVKSAELNPERSDIKSPDVVNCAIATIKSLKFPPSAKGMETTVNYPYNFKP